jgi:20S proteasome alpha/beta subunit
VRGLGIAEVTIGIAVIVPTQEAQIVTASDTRISWTGAIGATDEALTKNQRIGFKWGMLFAADDTTTYQPVLNDVRRGLGFEGFNDRRELEFDLVQQTVVDAYQKEYDKRFFESNLAKFRYNDVADFRQNGLNELGKELFYKFTDELRRFKLGLELLVYGFGPDGVAHVFEVRDPGVARSYDRNLYAAIGSGADLAYAALTRKKLVPHLESVIYRVLDAKFASENARDVGRKTQLLTLDRDGRVGEMRSSDLDQVRAIWDEQLKNFEPQSAEEVIGKSPAVTALSGEHR